MDPSDVKSLVRGWLQASPNVGRVKLTPPSLVPTFTPRPERLGLGAVPRQDLETRAYNSRLEKRIGRKLAGKRKAEDDAGVEPQVEKDLAADEMCGRSTSIYGKQARRKPAPECSLKTVRKRKKKRKTPVVSTADSPTSDRCTTRCSIAEHTEDPLPQRRQDLLRGGAQQDGDIQTRPLVTEQHLLPVKKTEKPGNVCSKNERSAPVEVVALPEGCSVDGEKKRRRRKGHRCVMRHRISLPWSSYGRRCRQRKHRPKRGQD